MVLIALGAIGGALVAWSVLVLFLRAGEREKKAEDVRLRVLRREDVETREMRREDGDEDENNAD